MALNNVYAEGKTKRNIKSAILLLSLISINILTTAFIVSKNNNIPFANATPSATSSSSYIYPLQSIGGGNISNSGPISSAVGIPYIGVDMQGLNLSLEGSHIGSQSTNSQSTNSQSTNSQSTNFMLHFPPNYYDDSFRIISQGGMNHVRIVFYWEAYEKDPTAFINELNTVAQTADKYGLKVMYDNHQFHTSSWLNTRRGTGFPPSLFNNNPTLYPAGSGGGTGYPTANVWWTNWWNRTIKDASGVDGWTLQANFLKKIVSTVDRHPSTLGYEILNEPQVHSIDQWTKIGTYNTFMVNQLRTLTHKTIAYSMNIPISLKSPIGVTPENLAKMAPANKQNVVFKISVYGIPDDHNYQQRRLDIFVKAAQLAGVPLYIGEWNNVRRVATPAANQSQNVDNQNFTTSPELSDINQTEANLIVQKLKDVRVWGMAFWSWDYAHSRVPSYNLIDVVSNWRDLAGSIQITKYFDIVKNAYSTLHDNLRNTNTTNNT